MKFRVVVAEHILSPSHALQTWAATNSESTPFLPYTHRFKQGLLQPSNGKPGEAQITKNNII
jgi:hypothetical protein